MSARLSSMQESELARLYGLRLVLGLAGAYPELANKMEALVIDKVAKAPFVPKDFVDNYRKLRAQYPNDLVTIASAVGGKTQILPDAPLFVADDRELATKWQELFDTCNKAQMRYAQGMSQQGASELAGLYASAAFWDGLYRVAVVVRDVPATAMGLVAKGAVDAVKANWKLFAVIGLGLAGWYFYKNPGAWAKVKGAASGAVKGASAA